MTLTLGGASLKQRWRDGNEELKENWAGVKSLAWF